MQICFNFPVPKRLSGVKILEGQTNDRQMRGLREMQVSERILLPMSLLKALINIWNEDKRPDADDENMWSEFEHDIELL